MNESHITFWKSSDGKLKPQFRWPELELIEDRIKTVEQDLKDVKDSIEYAHAAVDELKENNKTRKVQTKTKTNVLIN